MVQVTNISHDAVNLPAYGLSFGAGETIDVDPAVAAVLPPATFKDAGAPVAPPVVPVTAPAVVAAEAEVEKAAADLAAAQVVPTAAPAAETKVA